MMGHSISLFVRAYSSLNEFVNYFAFLPNKFIQIRCSDTKVYSQDLVPRVNLKKACHFTLVFKQVIVFTAVVKIYEDFGEKNKNEASMTHGSSKNISEVIENIR